MRRLTLPVLLLAASMLALAACAGRKGESMVGPPDGVLNVEGGGGMGTSNGM